MLALTDDQLDIVTRHAEPLAPLDRASYLRDVDALQGCELGDGIIARTCAEVQARYWRPPADHERRNPSKWSRRNGG